MDMDDDNFMGNIEFDLTQEQGNVVRQAIDLASTDPDAFRMTNPLIAIMQWWETNVPASEKIGGSPEATLVQACRLFVLAHSQRS
jgi:hypothetical protein